MIENEERSQEDARKPDWHPADILAALKKRGLTLAGLSVGNGYHPTAAGKALRRPWPALEQVIAGAIGVAPSEIWPSRYTGVDEAKVVRRRRRQASGKPASG